VWLKSKGTEMPTIAEMQIELEKQEAVTKGLREQMAVKSAEGFCDDLDEVVLRAGKIEITDAVKKGTKKLVAAVFGSDWIITNKNAKTAKNAGEFEWDALVETMRKKKITTEKKRLGKSALAILFFGDDKSDFKASTWNNTVDREHHLSHSGNLRSASYWVKSN
jgi:hypothetical protein